MHENKRFIQEQIDRRGSRQADLVRISGLSRALVSRILRDDRERLGQMPDESTMVSLAKAFGVSVETVRIAVSRALRDYVGEGAAPTADLSGANIDTLLEEIRRRVIIEDQCQTNTPSNLPVDGDARGGGSPMTLVPDDYAQYSLDQLCTAVGIGFAGSKDFEGRPVPDSNRTRSLVADEFDRWTAIWPLRYICDTHSYRLIEYFWEIDDGVLHRGPLAEALGLPFGKRLEKGAAPELCAARDVSGPTDGEMRRRPRVAVGEENQETESEAPA